MTYYLYYRIINTSPLRIADDSIAQKGQTGTMHYIPGSAVRGLVISRILAGEEKCDREKLFLETRFLNAYPVGKEGALIPSPKGFYEDKAEVEGRKPILNVVTGGMEEDNLKRARLSEFCSAAEDTLSFYSVRTGSDLKIRMDGDEMYRNEYIDRGYIFEGAVASEDREFLKDAVQGCFTEEFSLGSGRSAGMGRCRLLSLDIREEMPYKDYARKEDMEGECFLLMLSPASMRSEEGEDRGLDTECLGKKLGVENLKIKTCSTSIKEIFGYNRTWGSAVPSVTMYDKGSVFYLTFEGTLTAEKAQKLMDSGIGVRREEGFGRILFLADYAVWNKKQKGSDPDVETEDTPAPEAADREMLKKIARKYYRHAIEEEMNRWIIDHPMKKGNLNSSKVRTIEPILEMNRFDFPRAKKLLEEYFRHEIEKAGKQRVHQKLNNTETLAEHVISVLDGNIEELLSVEIGSKDSVMSVSKKELLSEGEIGMLKLQFLLKELRYDDRKEAGE